jgi:hypothetical protein
MAQHANLAIPARFSFRPFNAQWVVCWAELEGWWEEPKPISERTLPPIFALIPKTPKTKKLEQFLAREKVWVRVSVPTPEDLADDYLGFHLGAVHSVEVYRESIPLEVLPSHENKRNTPDISGREFPVLAYPTPEFESWFPFSDLRPESVAKDAWKMRDEFMALEKEPWALSFFLSRWGLWDSDRGYEARSTVGKPHLAFALAFPNVIWERRKRFADGLAGGSGSWLKNAKPLSFSQTNEPPFFSMECSYCTDAIEATISIDHLRKLKYRLCKREDCRKPYQVKTRQMRMYCSIKCAHLANVRKLRAEKRKAETTGRKNAKRKS